MVISVWRISERWKRSGRVRDGDDHSKPLPKTGCQVIAEFTCFGQVFEQSSENKPQRDDFQLEVQRFSAENTILVEELLKPVTDMVQGKGRPVWCQGELRQGTGQCQQGAGCVNMH